MAENNMSDLPSVLKERLTAFGATLERIAEHDVSGVVGHYLKENEITLSESDTALLAEKVAFDFDERYSYEELSRSTYYQPMMSATYEDGVTREYPSIENVTHDILIYWKKRAEEEKHPVLRSRYADLVWDFSEHITGERANFTIAQTVIDANIDVATNRVHKYDHKIITKLSRALSIALRINDKNRLQKVCETIMAFEDTIAQDSKLGLWGFSFDLLIKNRKVIISVQQKDKILSDLENRLSRVSNIESPETFDPHAAEAVAMRLARYYQRLSDKENVERVLRQYGGAFLKATEKADSLVGVVWLHKVYDVYLHYGMKADADLLNTRIRELGEKSAGEMNKLSHKFEITKKEMEAYLEAMTEGNFEKTASRIVAKLMPIKSEVEDQVKEISKETALFSLINLSIIDPHGRPVANIGSIEDDLDGRVIFQMSQNMGFLAVFLRSAIEKMIEIYEPTVDDLLAYLYRSPMFTLEKRLIIEAGIKAFLDEDHVTAIHILTPQIEDALRTLVKLMGGAIYKQGNQGGLTLMNFDKLLREECVVNLFGEDTTFYLRVLFTDQRGWNVRNNVCHGIWEHSFYDFMISDRLIHTLFIFAHVKNKQDGNENKDEP